MKNEIVNWTRNYFAKTGINKAVIGLSGGIDSSLCAAILKEALGSENVIGVLLPKGSQHDINCAYQIRDFLGINAYEVNIKDIVDNISNSVSLVIGDDPNNTEAFRINTPPRVRMTILYGFAALNQALVCNTCNLSEDYVGYSTKYGDSAGDFSLLANLTKTEVKALAREFMLPNELIEKTPEDGLSGKSDEDKLGFTYDTLDQYIRTGICYDLKIKEKIERMHKANIHKITLMPRFELKEGK